MDQGRRMKRYVTSVIHRCRTQVTFPKSSEEESSSEEEEEEKPKLSFRPKFVPKCVCPTKILPFLLVLSLRQASTCHNCGEGRNGSGY